MHLSLKKPTRISYKEKKGINLEHSTWRKEQALQVKKGRASITKTKRLPGQPIFLAEYKLSNAHHQPNLLLWGTAISADDNKQFEFKWIIFTRNPNSMSVIEVIRVANLRNLSGFAAARFANYDGSGASLHRIENGGAVLEDG